MRCNILLLNLLFRDSLPRPAIFGDPHAVTVGCWNWIGHRLGHCGQAEKNPRMHPHRNTGCFGDTGAPVKSVRRSTVTALVALGFLGSLFCLSLATPDIYYDVVYAGILISSALTVYFWRKERKADVKADVKTAPIGMWIVLGVILLFIVLCLLLPAL